MRTLESVLILLLCASCHMDIYICVTCHKDINLRQSTILLSQIHANNILASTVDKHLLI